MYSAKDARSESLNQLTRHQEIREIEEAIFTAVAANSFDAYVSDDTIMTTSTPEIVSTGTVSSPTVTDTHQLNIDGTEITFDATTGASLNNIIDHINAAAITGVVASKNVDKLVITKTGFTLNLQNGTVGTPLTSIGMPVGIQTSTPVSLTYFNVWKSVTANTTYTNQMNSVIKYFTDLGYIIRRITNSNTGTTFKWYITW